MWRLLFILYLVVHGVIQAIQATGSTDSWLLGEATNFIVYGQEEAKFHTILGSLSSATMKRCKIPKAVRFVDFPQFASTGRSCSMRWLMCGKRRQAYRRVTFGQESTRLLIGYLLFQMTDPDFDHH